MVSMASLSRTLRAGRPGTSPAADAQQEYRRPGPTVVNIVIARKPVFSSPLRFESGPGRRSLIGASVKYTRQRSLFVTPVEAVSTLAPPTADPTFEEIVADATDVFHNAVDVPGKQEGRFILFHAVFSVCSEKCRTTFAETGTAYTSVDVDIMKKLNYYPEYVSLRLMAFKDLPEDTMFVGEDDYQWSGSTSMTANGFDPAVVPTLVDMEEKKVVVDSKAICEYLLENDSERCTLLPESSEEENVVKKHLALVDDTPHPTLLYHGNIENDLRPQFIKDKLSAKPPMPPTAALEEQLAMIPESNQLLRRAYEAKISKLTAQGTPSSKSNEAKQQALDKTKVCLQELEKDLSASSGEWLCGAHFTVADLIWGNSLVRLAWLGNAYLWERLPNVKLYAEKLINRESLQSAVVKYPGYIPSPHL